MAPRWSAAFDMFALLALRNDTNGSANATMSRAGGVASCVVCPHVTITVSASINNQSAYLHEHQSPLEKKMNRSNNLISTHPVMMGNSRCRSVSRLVLSCQWGDLQVTQSVCRAGEETAEDGDGVRVSTPAFSTVTRCALQRPHRCFTWEIVASFYNQATISHYRLL